MEISRLADRIGYKPINSLCNEDLYDKAVWLLPIANCRFHRHVYALGLQKEVLPDEGNALLEVRKQRRVLPQIYTELSLRHEDIEGRLSTAQLVTLHLLPANQVHYRDRFPSHKSLLADSLRLKLSNRK